MGARVRGANRVALTGELVLCEVSLAMAVAGVAGGAPWWTPAAVLAFAGLSLAVLRRRGWGACEWLATAAAFRARARGRVCGPARVRDSGDDLFGVRGLRAYPYEDRERRVVGMVGDGTFLTAVVRVEGHGVGLRAVGGARELPLSVLADSLEVDGVVLASAQVVQQVRGQGAGRGVPASGPPAPALRLTWVALRLDPERCPEAVAARGGGLGGAQRCLVRAADQVASRLSGAGLRAVVLDQDGLNAASLAAGCPASAVPGQSAAPSPTSESSRVWRGGGLLHTTYAVTATHAGAGVPEGAVRLVSQLVGRTATVGLTVRRSASRRAVEVFGHVRVSCADERELLGACLELEQIARQAHVGIVRLDREQLPGALATLPLGGAR